METPPLNLNPRSSLDATSQRVGALIFTALARIDEDLNPVPDLARSWQTSSDGLRWTFRIRLAHRDHAGQSITAALMAQCLEEYRAGMPRSPLVASFPNWISTRALNDSVVIELSKPDPFFIRNVSLLRYFTSKGKRACAEPDEGATVVTSGRMKPRLWQKAPDNEMELIPVDPALRPALLRFVRDESTRTLMLLRNEIDLAQSTISLTKTRWFARAHSDRYGVNEREGTSVAYLGFNLKDPLLRDVKIRQAIAHAIDRERVVQHKFFGLASLAGSFLAPALEGSHQIQSQYDPAKAHRLLDEAGFPTKKDGVRFKLQYRSTPYRENVEMGLLLREFLGKVGIALEVEPVEPAAFFAGLRQGNFQLYYSRWVGVADGSIFYRAMHSSHVGNRVGYSDPATDSMLDKLMSEPVAARRMAILRDIQEVMGRDLPYLPLFYWKNSLIYPKTLEGEFGQRKISLSSALDPLVYRNP